MLPTVRVHNTMSRSVEELEPRHPGKVGLYVCGMTVYDYTHIGHARAMMAFDVVVRHLRHRGYDVHFVRNHTDIDDKVIARAARLGVEPITLSRQFIDALEEDLDALGMVRPTVTPKVTEHVPEIVDLIQSLMDSGHAYKADNGDVYFAVESFPDYGRLSGKKVDELRAGERVAVELAKHHPADFALWTAHGGDETEPSWPSPWGPGRPGWHIECSAMARKHLGDTFDLHGGGIDLVFPHHENEIAQSECGTGQRPMARYWLHNGHLTLDQEKMSKSLGNIVRIRDILREVPAEALRLLYLETHYRSPLPYASDRLVEALRALDRMYSAKETIEAAGGEADPAALGEAAVDAHRLGTEFPARFYAAMDEDFNTAGAVGHFFDLVRAVNRFGNDKKVRAKGGRALAPAKAAFALVAEVLGVAAMSPQAFFDDVKVKRLAAAGKSAADVDAKVAERAAARAGKDWARADALRVELDAEGIVVMDGQDGSTWRMRIGE
jgi:cysteinyl-tRNA synthetase